MRQILTVSRRTERQITPLHLPLLLPESLTLLRASLPSTLDIQQHIASDVGTVLADATQRHQVVLNLGANAEYAMRQTGGVLEVRLEDVQVDATLAAQHSALRPGPYVRLLLRDTGHGMSPEVMQHIYEPFFTTKGVGEGTGIGLSVVHGIVAEHSGAIMAQSRVGHGTTFMIYLPRREPPCPAVEPQAEHTPHGRERILLVDDESDLVILELKLLI
ncbi:MAG: ATP-binding protein [Candidatus Tectimicrobiota bacterium]